MTMEDGYVDIDAFVNDLDYAEEPAELFDDNFFNSLGDDNETN